MVPTSSQIRLFGAPNQGNTISRALTVFLSRRASSSRFHRRHSNKSSSKPPTSAIKVNLKKLAPAFRSLCLYPRWSHFTRQVYEPLYGQPTHYEQLTSSQTHFRAYPALSHLQTKQLQPVLGIPLTMSMYAYNSRNQNEQPPPARSQSSREAVPWGSSTFNLPYKVSSSAGPLQKRHFFFSTLKTITSADGSFANKVGVLASRFETGEILLREAHGHLAPMYDETNRQPIWDSPAFQITNPVLMNESGRSITVPNPTAEASIEQLPS